MNDTELAVLKQISTPTKISDISNQKTLRKLLIDGKAYSPQEGYVVATTPVTGKLQAPQPKEEGVWETRMPKTKRKGETPEPYEFCPYTKYSELPSDILSLTREVTFTDYIEHEGYKYKKIAGGVMRRPIK